MSLPASTLDLRTIAPRERHPLIFSTFGALATGDALELVNDHDPQPLHGQFMAYLPRQFDWRTVEAGPETWRVRITKVADPHANGSCCGSCG